MILNVQTVTILTMKARPPLWRFGHYYEGVFENVCGESEPGCPEVWEVPPGQFSTLTEPWQRAWFAANSRDPEHPTEKELQAWAAYTKGTYPPVAFTDFNGTDTLRDHIRNLNTDKTDPKIRLTACGGMVVTGKPYWHYNQQGIPVEERLAVECMDWAAGPDPRITPKDYPWFWPDATMLVVGKALANPFPQLGGRLTGIPVRYPFMGKMSLKPYIPMWKLFKVRDDEEIPNPYYPPMQRIVYR